MILLPDTADALVVLDARRRIRRLNSRAVSLLGRPASALIGLPWSSLPPELTQITRTETLLGRHHRDTLFVVTLLARDGSAPSFPHAELVSPWEDSGEMAIVRGLDGLLLAVNANFARKFSVTVEAMLGHDPATLIHPDDLPDWRRQVARQNRAHQRLSLEHRWQTAQGWRWLSWEESPLHDAHGEVFAYRAIGRDLTKRRLAEEHFYKLANIVEQSPISVVLTTPDGRVQYVNPRYTQTTGYTLEDIFERHIEVLRQGFKVDRDYKELLETVSEGDTWRGELRSTTKTGEEVWESVQVSPIRNHDGAITHVLCLREDLTSRKQLEDQLRQAQKMESLGTLAGGISHDFNNLIAVISGFCELALARETADERVTHYLGEIHHAAKRAAALVRQILTFGRKHEVVTEPVLMHTIIHELGSMLQETFPRNIRFAFRCDVSLPAITADPNQLRQVVMNLCVNARDAMLQGGHLTLTTRRVEGATLARLGATSGVDYLAIDVEDTGQGMPPEIKSRIFEPFFTTKAKTGGTGLGLSMVYGIITGHGGVIGVESTPGVGTIFSVYLPFPVGVFDEQVSKLSTPNGAIEIPPGRETILIVEDEPGLRRLLELLLAAAGYHVYGAGDGAEAVEFLQRHTASLDAVLLDLNLPHVDGAQVHDVLKHTRPETQILITSGHITPELRSQIDALGQHTFINKPYQLSDLGRELRKCLDRAANAVTPPAPPPELPPASAAAQG